MNEVIIFGSKKHLLKVYSSDNTYNIETLKGLKFFDMKDIKSNISNFEGTKYIFSTWGFPEMSKTDIKKFFPSLKAIFYAAGTTNYFSKNFKEIGIDVFDSSEANSIAVSHFVLGIILLANKGYFRAIKRYKIPIYKYSFITGKNIANMYGGNYNKKVGILALGNTGTKLAALLKSFDFDVYAYDPYIDDILFQKYGVNKASIDFIFENCDVISNHMPDIPETYRIIDYNLLKKMKKNSILINSGRGAQINDMDLFRVLFKNRKIQAFLDVTSKEPLLPFSKWFFLRNVYLSPHIAGSVGEEYKRMILEAVANYKSFIE